MPPTWQKFEQGSPLATLILREPDTQRQGSAPAGGNRRSEAGWLQNPRCTSSVDSRAAAGYGSPPFKVRQRISFSSAAGAASGAEKSSRSDCVAPVPFA